MAKLLSEKTFVVRVQDGIRRKIFAAACLFELKGIKYSNNLWKYICD